MRKDEIARRIAEDKDAVKDASANDLKSDEERTSPDRPKAPLERSGDPVSSRPKEPSRRPEPAP